MTAPALAAPGLDTAPAEATSHAPAPRPQRPPAPARSPYSRERKILGDPSPLACTVAKTAVEVVLGGQGLETLTRWISAELREALAQQASLARRAGLRGVSDARVLRARVFRVSRSAAEVSLVVSDGTHARAVAMRLEDCSGRWLTTVLDIG